MNKLNKDVSVYETTIRLFVLLLIIAWCMMIIYPFVSIILWSLILGMALFPLHQTMAKWMGGRPKLASFIIVLAILAIFIVPMGLMIGSMVDEVKSIKALYDSGNLIIPEPSVKIKEWPIIGEQLFNFWKNASVNLGQTLIKYKEQIAEIGGRLGKGLLGAAGDIIQILVSVIIAGILLISGNTGPGLRKFFRKIAGDKGDEYADIVLKTVGNVVKGILGVAFILAVIHGTILFLAHIPYAGIWTLLIFVLCIVQIPSFFVTVPLMIYLFAVKEPLPATLWTVAMILAGLADNILKPLLLGKGAPVPMLVIFIGVIGGFILSGFIGLFTGAIVMSLGYRLYVEWIG
jgi:predicted PurR-regulated permease PerM